MAIADTITSMQTHTSNAYTMIGYGTDLTGINKNLENLSTSIFKAFLESLNNPDTLFTNLPKITGTGSNITLNDTANAPMRIELSPSELTQETTTGKNTFNDTLTSGSNNGLTWVVNPDKSVKITGTASATTYINFGSWNLSGNYIFSGITGGSGSTYRLYLSGSLSNLETITTEEKTITNDGTSYNMILRVESGKSVGEIVYPMIRPSTIASNTYEPYTGGIASPNPQYPQDIHTISGDNTLTICSNNLAIKNIKGYANMSNNSITVDNGSESFVFYAIQGQQYTFNSAETLNRSVLSKIDTDSPVTGTPCVSYGSVSRTFTSPFTGYAFLYVNSSLNDKIKDSFIINNGTTALPYEPYISQTANVNLGDIEYCKMPNTNYKDQFIRTSGKNLFDKSNITQGKYLNASGNEENDSTKFYTDYIYVHNKQAIASSMGDWSGICTCYYNSNKQFISSETGSTIFVNGNKFTIPSNAYYMRVSNSVPKLDILQIQYGTTITDYEPYGSNEWYIKKNIGKIVLDGSEADWTLNNSGTPNYSYRLSLAGQLITGNGISNLYPYVSAIYDGNTSEGFSLSNASTTYLQIRVRYGTEQTLTDFKTFLGTNNLIIYYILSTPTYTKITGTLAEQLEYVYQLLKSYKGVTNISQVNNDLPFELDVQAIEDIE